jgi:hypothetical protein
MFHARTLDADVADARRLYDLIEPILQQSGLV